MSRMTPKQIRAAQARHAKLNPPLPVHEHIADPELESFDRFDRMDYYNQANDSGESFAYRYEPEMVNGKSKMRHRRIGVSNNAKSNNSNELFDYKKRESVYDGFADTIGFVG